jgi:hypothetical protein
MLITSTPSPFFNGREGPATPKAPTNPPSPHTEQLSPVSDADQVLDEVQARLEQDVDYQIIKHTFRSGESASKIVNTPSDNRVTAQSERRPETVNVSVALNQDVKWERTALLSIDRGSAAASGDFTLSVQTLSEERIHLSFGQQADVQRADPLVLDLGRQGISTTGIDQGFSFDLTGDGVREQVSFVAGDNWFLALDRNNNGTIDDGRELFGDQQGAANGFEELARFDDNQDGMINAEDSVFERLRLFRMDANGQQQLNTLEQARITAIHLDYINVEKALNNYDVIAQIGQFERNDGRVGKAADVLLGYRSLA